MHSSFGRGAGSIALWDRLDAASAHHPVLEGRLGTELDSQEHATAQSMGMCVSTSSQSESCSYWQLQRSVLAAHNHTCHATARQLKPLLDATSAECYPQKLTRHTPASFAAAPCCCFICATQLPSPVISA